MSKFLRFFLISALSVMFFQACSNSSNSDNKEEYQGDGTEEFVTVGNSHSKSSDEEDYSDTADGEAAPEQDAGDENGGDAEREIVESDIYKFDSKGNVLWLANQYKGLIAVDISDPENLRILDTVKFKGYVGEMYLQEGRAYILVSNTNEKYDSGEIYYYGRTYSKIIVVNTEDPENLEILGDFEMDGWIADSRQVGDVIYVAATQYAYSWNNCEGESGTEGANQIMIKSINIKDPKHIKEIDSKTLEGVSYTFYVSQKSIYVAEADSYYWNEDYKEGYPVTMFDISDPEGKIVKKAEFETDGFMSDRWKMHEVGNTFFAVSSSSQWGNGDSFIESFDISDPEKIERLDKLIFMTNQQLYGTKFEGDRMYAVTYFQQDPLHIIDISDPANLKELGKLEVPGWSDFIEVRGTRLLAVGRDGNNSKISLYDVSDPKNPKEIDTVQIGSDYSYSEANYDWKAFKIFDDLGLILFPVTDYGDAWDSTYKLYLVDFDLDKGLKTRGFINSSSYIRRGVAIQDLIFSIGENHLVTADATDRDDPKILSELTLAEFVYEINKCGKFLCSLNDSKLVVYDKKLKKLWESKPFENYSDYYSMTMMKNSNYAYIYNGTSYYYDSAMEDWNESGPKIKIVKFTDDGNFKEIGDFPFEGSFRYNSYPVVSENNVMAFYSSDYMYYNKIYFLDMNKPADGIKGTIFDFDYENLSYERNLFASGNTFWSSGCKLKKESKDGDQYYCYAVQFDVSDPSNPKQKARVNIPGELVGISDDGKYLYSQTPRIYGYYNDCAETDADDCWGYDYSSDFYILKLNDKKTAVSVVKKKSLSYYDKYENGKSEYVVEFPVVKNDKVFFISSVYGTEWNVCYYRNDEHFDISLVSAETGKELAKESFDDVYNYSVVKDGGLLVNTAKGLNYIDKNGKSKKISDDSNLVNIGISDSQLFEENVYISAGWDGFYSISVK